MAHPASAAARDRPRLRAVFALSAGVLVVEVAGAILSGSLALIADAGHVLADVLGIGLSLGAIRLAGRPATGDRTFGLLRLEVLAAVGNGAILLGVAAYIGIEAVGRLTAPPEVASLPMVVAAIVGLVANGVSAVLLRSRQSLNARGARLEVLGDLFGSATVLVAGTVIAVTGRWQADIVASVLIAVVIVPRALGLLREALDVILEAVPQGIRLEEVRAHILDAPGVTDVHDLHAWTITAGVNVVSAHVVVGGAADPARVLDHLERCLSGDFDIEHSTFQLETDDRRRLELASHP